MANILIIEDDVYLAEDLKFFIEEENHTCQFYSHADEVLKNYDNLGQYDWLILDIMMLKGELIDDKDPAIETGEVLYQRIRTKYPKMKILILSAKDFNDMAIKFDRDPNVKVMSKPVTGDKLKELLNIISGKSTS